MSDRMKANRMLLKHILVIHTDSHETYGSPRVFAALKKKGVSCSEKRVARLMSQASLTGRVVKVTRRAPGVQRFYERHENLRLGKPAPSAINQLACPPKTGPVSMLEFVGVGCTPKTVPATMLVFWAFKPPSGGFVLQIHQVSYHPENCVV